MCQPLWETSLDFLQAWEECITLAAYAESLLQASTAALTADPPSSRCHGLVSPDVFQEG